MLGREPPAISPSGCQREGPEGRFPGADRECRPRKAFSPAASRGAQGAPAETGERRPKRAVITTGLKIQFCGLCPQAPARFEKRDQTFQFGLDYGIQISLQDLKEKFCSNFFKKLVGIPRGETSRLPEVKPS